MSSGASFWDKAAAKYARDPIADMAAYEETRDRLRAILQPHHRVLEVGCGTGSTALELADGVARYTGTDVSPRMIAIAQAKRTDDTPAGLGFEVREAASLPPGPHDVILALNVLHLLPDLEEVLRLVHTALPPGGLLVTKTALLKDGAWFLPWIIPPMRLVGKAPYVRVLGGTDLLDLLEKAGFTVTETLLQDAMVPRLFAVAAKP